MPQKVGKKVGIHFYNNVLSKIYLPLLVHQCIFSFFTELTSSVLYRLYSFANKQKKTSQTIGMEIEFENLIAHTVKSALYL